MLHPDDTSYFQRLREIGFEAARQLGIRCDVIEPKRRAGGALGLAYLVERRISIEVRGKRCTYDGGAWSAQRWSDTCNFHTLAHELAHLWEHQQHGKTGHGKRFKDYERRALATVNAVRCSN